MDFKEDHEKYDPDNNFMKRSVMILDIINRKKII